MNYAIRDKGGRPRKNFVRGQIKDILSELGKATTAMIYKKYKETIKDDKKIVHYDTVFRYLKQMADEGVINKIKVTEGKQREVHLFSLAVEHT